MPAYISALFSWLACRFQSRTELERAGHRFAPPGGGSESPASWPSPIRHGRSAALGPALPTVAALSEGYGVGQAGNGNPMGIVKASACFGDGVQNPGGLRLKREIRDLIRRMNVGNPLWGAPGIPRRIAQARHRNQSSDRRQVQSSAKTVCCRTVLARVIWLNDG